LANLFLIKFAFLFEEINPVEIKSTRKKMKEKKYRVNFIVGRIS
jgi:hypothetical protein